jgi:chromosome segregation ATPase
MAETEKQRYEEYESFRKSRQKSEADFIESLQDQLDVSKKITDSYKNIVTKLEKANDLQDKARVMQHRINEEMQKNQVKISALDKIILKNQTELNGLKREMVSNDNRLLQIDTAKEILDQKRLVTEQELKNSMDKREGLQWAISEKVREETEQRARSLDMSTRITDNNEQQARIQGDIKITTTKCGICRRVVNFAGCNESGSGGESFPARKIKFRDGCL